MAVYTEVSDDELRAFATFYDIGEVLSCKGIAEGVENSNYLVTTERGNFILTLYEKRVAPRRPAVLHRADGASGAAGVACPTPVRGATASRLRELCGRPAAIVTFLAGMWPRRIQPHHCAASSAGALAGLHLAGASFAMARPNDLSASPAGAVSSRSCRCRADEVQPGLAAELGGRTRTARKRMAARASHRGHPRRSLSRQCLLSRR